MRLLALDLDRYGPFTGRRLDFLADRPLAVVHGANEAGKSSALAGLVDALFSIETRSAFDFIHDYKAMRVGARIVARSGAELEFRRRKGTKATLLGPDEQPLADDALAPFLGRVDRAMFMEAFGLDQPRLRAGALALTRGEGSLGEALLAAAPGLGRLVDLRREVADRAGALFSERRSAGKPFYRAYDQWDDARRRLAEASLSADALARARRELDAAGARVTEVERERHDLRRAEARVARLRRTLPRLARLDALRAEQAGLAVPPGVDAAFADQVAAAEAEIARATTEGDLHRREREPVRAEWDATVIPDDLLADAAAIDRLGALKARRASAADDLASARARIATSRAALADAARNLGITDPETLTERRPTAPAMAAVQALAKEGLGLAVSEGAARKALAEANDRLARLAAPDPAVLIDPRGARALLDGLAALPGTQATHDLRLKARETAARRLDEGRLRAGVADWTAEALRTRALPDRAEVDRLAAALSTGAATLADMERRRAEADARRTDADARLAAMTADRDVPDDAAIAAAREARTAAWQRARDILFDGTGASPADRLAAAHAVERTIAEVDRLTDGRAAAADRLAAITAARDAAARAAAEVARADDALAKARRTLEALDAEWSALAASGGLAGTTPREMIHLLDRHGDLVGLADALEAADAEADLAARDLARLDEAVTSLAADLGLVRPSGAGWTAMLPKLRQAVEDLETRWTDARDRERDRRDCRERAEQARAALAEVAAGRARWAADWDRAVATIGLAPGARIEEAEAALAVWTDLAGHAAALLEARALVDRLQAECADFDDRAEAARKAHAPDLSPDASSGEIVARLVDRLAEARRAADRRLDLTRRLTDIDEKIRHAEAVTAAEKATLHRLRAAVGAAPDADLHALVATARIAEDRRRRIAEESDALVTDTGSAEEALRQEAEGTDADSLDVEAAEIAEHLAELDRAHEAAVAERTTAEHAWRAVAERDGAEAAGQAEQNALAAIADVAEDWRVLQAAGRILGAVVEEFRRRHQNPVLDEAGRLFAELTRGRYPGLAADFDDDGRARLVAVREDGTRLDPDALSEGTRDQLFLALRLATLVDHGRRAEPLPFIGDDLFVTFDEARTAAGLATLARFGESAQAILFTHHEHVVEIAEATLGERVQVLRL